jgi:hypothetical protein
VCVCVCVEWGVWGGYSLEELDGGLVLFLEGEAVAQSAPGLRGHLVRVNQLLGQMTQADLFAQVPQDGGVDLHIRCPLTLHAMHPRKQLLCLRTTCRVRHRQSQIPISIQLTSVLLMQKNI